MQNGTISLKVTPYVGTYDGQEHNALSNICVEPSDAKLEYSLDGENYVTEMPKIKDTSEFTVTVVASKEGYKTVSTTETIKVNRAEGKLTLSSYSGTLTYPNSTSFTINENTTNVSITSSNTNIATASLNGNTVTVKPGTTAGKAIITVTTEETINYTSKTATYEATVNNGSIDLMVTPYTGNYDGRQHNAVTVNVTPSDAKLEYSTNNGASYNTTMPTIINASSFTVTVRASKTGYKTESSTQTTKVNKANGSLSLSFYSGTITYPNSTSFTVSGNTGTLSVSSSNTNVATASLNGNTVTIKSVGAGSATITVKSASNTNYNEKTAAYAVTVKIPTFTESSGVGYYADVDGNGTVDGIIYADRKIGASGNWGGTYYTISTVTGLKEYYVSKTNYNGPFGTKNVLSARGSGNARFNVMALSDYNNGATYRFTDAKAITSGEWSTPSRNEWAAFGRELGITNSNYSGYGLKGYYWSASANSSITDCGYCAHVSAGKIDIYHYTYDYPVRLARTF